MRVAVYPHTLEIGGSQLNALDLAAAVREYGVEVVVFGQPGPLEDRIEALGLDFVTAPLPRRRPSPAVMRALCDLVRARGVDLVHGYEWTTTLEAFWGPLARLDTPVVSTVMSMSVAPFLPRDLPLVVGTEQIAAHERALGRRWVNVIEPPVDVDENAPTSVDPRPFRERYGLGADDFVVTGVTRLAPELKLEGLLVAIDVAGELAAGDERLRLVLAGDGPARAAVAARADAVNRRAGREVVVLTGELTDPRAAYAAADVCFGMGGSALRALAFGKPLLVQGERGFWELLTPQTLEQFLWTGWYGVGSTGADGRASLLRLLGELRHDPALRERLGGFGRTTAVRRFSLRAAAGRQHEVYAAALDPARGGPPSWRSTGASGLRFARYEVARRAARLAGRAASDDFNARPVAAGKETG